MIQRFAKCDRLLREVTMYLSNIFNVSIRFLFGSICVILISYRKLSLQQFSIISRKLGHVLCLKLCSNRWVVKCAKRKPALKIFCNATSEIADNCIVSIPNFIFPGSKFTTDSTCCYPSTNTYSTKWNTYPIAAYWQTLIQKKVSYVQ